MSAVIQLFTSHSDKKWVTAAILVFGADSVMFIFPLIVAVLAFSAAAELNAIPDQLDTINTFATLVMFLAIYVFIAGIALTGWIRSKLTGTLPTIFALITMCLVTYVIYSVSLLFPAT
jgi:cytochrome b561